MDSNVAAVQDSLIASVKVTPDAERAYFTTKTGYKVLGWTELNKDTGKKANKKELKTGVNEVSKDWYKGLRALGLERLFFPIFQSHIMMKRAILFSLFHRKLQIQIR